jgi:hypothetical protein
VRQERGKAVTPKRSSWLEFRRGRAVEFTSPGDRFGGLRRFYRLHRLWAVVLEVRPSFPATSYRGGVGSRATPGLSGETSGVSASAGDPHLFEVVRGVDCRDVLSVLPPAVFDAAITDPPYGIGIADWDRDVPGGDVWTAVMRVLKPGAPLVAFAGRRTYHRLAAAVESGGFRVVDQALWLYRTGRRPSRYHLRPAHELILVARAPGRPAPVNLDAARIPYKDEADRVRVRRIDTIRRGGRRRPVYSPSLEKHGRTAFAPHAGGREPTTVLMTDEILGEASQVFMIPKVRDVAAHPCAKPPELLAHLVHIYVWA